MLALFPGDSALLLLVLVLGGFIGFGMVTDGIRMALLLVASVISYFVAPLLGGFVPKGLLPKNIIWREAGVGDIHAFIILMVLLFIGIHFLHRWITIEVKYKLPARKHNEWARVNSVLGLCMGGITGVLYYLMLAGLITPVGYATAQMPAADSAKDPTGYRLAGRLYKDFKTLGVDRAASAFNPATADYYSAMDVAGLIYQNYSTNQHSHNHILLCRARLMSYPGLIDLAYNPKVSGLMNTNVNFLTGIYGHSGLSTLIIEPQFQAAYVDPEVRSLLSAVDLEDLRKYMIHLNDIEKGSTKFTSAALVQQNRPKILGRWVLDVENTVQQFEVTFENMDDRAKDNLRQYIEAIGDGMSISFSDGKFYFAAKYFHEQALARKSNQLIPRIPSSTSISAIQRSALGLKRFGPWETVDNSRFKLTFRWQGRNGIEECPVVIDTGPSQIILTLENFENEKYVFRRQKF